MATLIISLTIGAQTGSVTLTPSDARAIEFLDDLIARHYTDVDIPLTRAQAGQRYVNELAEGVSTFAQGLKQRRFDSEVPQADRLT